MNKIILTALILSLSIGVQAQEAKDPLLEILNEPVKQEKAVVKKEQKKEVNTSVVKTLGSQKYKVFKKTVDELPKEVNVIYVTEADFKKIEKEFKQKQKEEQLALKKAKEDSKIPTKLPEKKVVTKTIEMKPVVTTVDIVSKEEVEVVQVEQIQPIIVSMPPVKEIDPEPTMMKEHPVTAMEVAGATNSIEITNKEELVVVAEEPKKTPEVLAEPVLVVKDSQIVKEEPATVAASEKEIVPDVAIKVAAPSPIKLIDKEQLRNMLNEELGKDASEYKPSTVKAIDEEKQKVVEMMGQMVEQKRFDEAVSVEKERILKGISSEKESRQNAPLADIENPGKAATDKELAPVKLNVKKDRPADKIDLPAVVNPVKELTEEEVTKLAEEKVRRKEAQITRVEEPKAMKAHSKNLNILNEQDGIEEASGPSYGFGSEP